MREKYTIILRDNGERKYLKEYQNKLKKEKICEKKTNKNKLKKKEKERVYQNLYNILI